MTKQGFVNPIGYFALGYTLVPEFSYQLHQRYYWVEHSQPLFGEPDTNFKNWRDFWLHYEDFVPPPKIEPVAKESASAEGILSLPTRTRLKAAQARVTDGLKQILTKIRTATA